jgi:hypothetical protein
MKNIPRPLIALLAVGALALTTGCSSSSGPGAKSDNPSIGGLPMTVTTKFNTRIDKAAAALLPQDVLDR